jgi:uncharacterized damage-inducible protein DinB
MERLVVNGLGSIETAGRVLTPEVTMVPALVEQYRRWFEYETDSHRKVLASLETVPEDGRRSEPFQKAMNIMGHIIAARRTWLYRLGASADRPANLFPADVTRDGLTAELDVMERGWSDYLARLDEAELQRVFTYQSNDGAWFRSAIADVLTQLYGHSLYHRGQIASLVRAAGGQPAKTDFIFWSREAIPPPV